MNAVEIEEAVSALAERPFDAAEFPFAFLEAFSAKATTIKRLRKGETNKSDVGGILQRDNIHLAIADPGAVTETLGRLKASPATTKAKAKFVLATDGDTFEAEDVESGETVACDYADFPDHFGFFLPLAGISTVRQLRESSFDIRATSRLNRLYRTLLEENPDWDAAKRRADMNHFMARLIFCFFAEDTDIFHRSYPFTGAIERMSERDSSNTHEVIGELFRAMNTPTKHNGALDDRYRRAAGIRNWANPFPYVNGGLFSGSLDVPRFSRIARSYLLHIGGLDWTKINPDIFGSMIQAVADDEERGALGMHYTSVPNILKVLNPLFLDDLCVKLAEAGDNARKLLNLRNRMARIRVFDPACGSGNFLVIAYKQMREIEAEINVRRGESDRASDIPLTNFRGIELRDFPAEIARLALIIAEYQADVLYRGQKLALAEFLPLDQENWITCGNALRLDWLCICPPTGPGVKLVGDDLFRTPLHQSEIDFENEGGETYICGNPPYVGKGKKSSSENADMAFLFDGFSIKHGYVDYAASWFLKAAVYAQATHCDFAYVVTNSICQGHQVPLFWPTIFRLGYRIRFAYPSFRWANLAANNAGVTVAIIGITRDRGAPSRLYVTTSDGAVLARDVDHINAYLVPAENVIVDKRSSAAVGTASMDLGNMPYDGGNLLMSTEERAGLGLSQSQGSRLTRRIYGSQEYISGTPRYCLWIENTDLEEAMSVQKIASRLEAVRQMRLRSPDKSANAMAQRAHQMREMRHAHAHTMIVPRTSSETRSHLPAGLLPVDQVVSSEAFALFDAPLWTLGLLLSRLHLVWIATVCGKLETRYRYSNVLGWNTFPVPPLTEKMKADLTRCADDILLAREVHFPATIAKLYDPERMDRDFPDLRAAHDRNDEVLERIYIGRRFKNDTERLEKLFELYTKMTAGAGAAKKQKARANA